MVHKNHRGVQRSIAEQALAMRSKYRDFNTVFDFKSLKVEGLLKPTARSISYKFTLKFLLGKYPTIKILSPLLQKNKAGDEIPHLYSNGNLCLYHPLFGEFFESDLFCDTIIPWATLWLYYYEIWHLTGEWKGGGVHPPKRNMKK